MSERTRTRQVAPAPEQIQTRLTVNRPGDRFEQEAEHIAAQVMAGPQLGAGPPAPIQPTSLPPPTAGRPISPANETDEIEELAAEEEIIQTRAAATPLQDVPRPVEQRIHQARGGGLPLSAGLRRFFEPRFGHDFSAVRLHTDAAAAQFAQALQSHAFTIGRDIFFAPGQFSPHSPAGRHLLAHELTHVLQQTGPRPTAPAGVIHRAENTDVADRPTLQSALDGDDDEVRALVDSDKWKAIKLKPEEVATLLIHLFDGHTGDEDEEAAIKIVQKAHILDILDDALTNLVNRDRFSDLFDDFHGEQYDEMIMELAEDIDRKDVKAVYLNKFISMWWVDYEEEEAVVVALELADAADLPYLLGSSREKKLRSAVDDDDLSTRFEEVVGSANEKRFKNIEAALNKIFVVKAKRSSTTGQRSTAETTDLLLRAAMDLAKELLEYQVELSQAIGAPDFDPSDAAEINEKFEKRLAELLELKKREFDLELKYNIEFNRSTNKKFRTNWTKNDLKKIEKILDVLPPEIFAMAEDLKSLGREKGGADYAGVAREDEQEIGLSGPLTLGTTTHEFGHFVHFANLKMFEEYRALTPWEPLLKADFKKHIPDTKRRKKVLKELDRHRNKELDFETVVEDSYHYRYARYSPDYLTNYQDGKDYYWRYPKKACFVTDYAATDPQDDFAESFAHYVENKKFKKKCQDKYDFIHVRVFVKFWLDQQMARVLEEVKKDHLDEAPGYIGINHLDDPIIKNFQTPLYDSLENDLELLIVAKVQDAQSGKLPERIPMKGNKEVQQTASRYIPRWRNLTNLITPVRVAFADIANEASTTIMFTETEEEEALSELTFTLLEKAAEELYAEFEPPAKQVMTGREVTMPAWPAVEAIKNKYLAAMKVVPGYVAAYARARYTRAEFIPAASSILNEYKDPAEREQVRKFLITQRPLFEAKATGLMDSIMKGIMDGVEFSKANIQDPAAQIQQFKQDLRDAVKAQFAKKKGGKKVKRQAIDHVNGKAPAGLPPLVSTVLTAHGRPMPAALQREMEARFAAAGLFPAGQHPVTTGLVSKPADPDEQAAEQLAARALAGNGNGGMKLPPDFSHIRIHTDDRAAASARALQARAYTTGEHIVFGRGAYAPETLTGRRLLAHELSHIVQPQPVENRIQRDFWRDVAVFFGAEGSYDDTELLDYLADRRKAGVHEGDFDSDNKARAIVRNWKAAKQGFALQPEDKVILIQEMLDGPTLDEDEKGILDLLELSELGDIRRIFRDVGAPLIHENIQGDNRVRLEQFFDQRVEGGTAAALQGSLALQGQPFAGAPLFAYAWSDLLRRIDDFVHYRPDEIAQYINTLPKTEKEQAFNDLQQERAKRETTFKKAHAATQNELLKWNQLVNAGANQTDISNQELAFNQAEYRERMVRIKIDRVEETLNALGISLAKTATGEAELKSAAKTLTPAEKTAAKEAVKPPPETTPAGAPIPFTDPVNYEADLDKLLADLIKGFYDKLVKDKGAVEHSDKTKVYDLQRFETIGQASKKVTDEVFGSYKKGPALKADDPAAGLRGNIHDFWQDMEDAQAGMTPDEKQAEAKDHLKYLLSANRKVHDLNRQYHAGPEFDDAGIPLNDEAKVQDKLTDKYKVSHTTEMLHIRRGWSAAAKPETGDIFVQLWRMKAGNEERSFFWERFLVLIHEYLHTLAHSDYREYAKSFGPRSVGYNTLMEGMDSVLTEIVWHHAQKRARDKDIRDPVEGPPYNTQKFDPAVLPAGRDPRYRSYDEAQELVRIVGLENVYLAYFFGDVSRLGK